MMAIFKGWKIVNERAYRKERREALRLAARDEDLDMYVNWRVLHRGSKWNKSDKSHVTYFLATKLISRGDTYEGVVECNKCDYCEVLEDLTDGVGVVVTNYAAHRIIEHLDRPPPDFVSYCNVRMAGRLKTTNGGCPNADEILVRARAMGLKCPRLTYDKTHGWTLRGKGKDGNGAPLVWKVAEDLGLTTWHGCVSSIQIDPMKLKGT